MLLEQALHIAKWIKDGPAPAGVDAACQPYSVAVECRGLLSVNIPPRQINKTAQAGRMTLYV